MRKTPTVTFGSLSIDDPTYTHFVNSSVGELCLNYRNSLEVSKGKGEA